MLTGEVAETDILEDRLVIDVNTGLDEVLNVLVILVDGRIVGVEVNSFIVIADEKFGTEASDVSVALVTKVDDGPRVDAGAVLVFFVSSHRGPKYSTVLEL